MNTPPIDTGAIQLTQQTSSPQSSSPAINWQSGTVEYNNVIYKIDVIKGFWGGTVSLEELSKSGKLDPATVQRVDTLVQALLQTLEAETGKTQFESVKFYPGEIKYTIKDPKTGKKEHKSISVSPGWLSKGLQKTTPDAYTRIFNELRDTISGKQSPKSTQQMPQLSSHQQQSQLQSHQQQSQSSSSSSSSSAVSDVVSDDEQHSGVSDEQHANSRQIIDRKHKGKEDIELSDQPATEHSSDSTGDDEELGHNNGSRANTSSGYESFADIKSNRGEDDDFVMQDDEDRSPKPIKADEAKATPSTPSIFSRIGTFFGFNSNVSKLNETINYIAVLKGDLKSFKKYKGDNPGEKKAINDWKVKILDINMNMRSKFNGIKENELSKTEHEEYEHTAKKLEKLQTILDNIDKLDEINFEDLLLQL